jgi:hypothetical protein
MASAGGSAQLSAVLASRLIAAIVKNLNKLMKLVGKLNYMQVNGARWSMDSDCATDLQSRAACVKAPLHFALKDLR